MEMESISKVVNMESIAVFGSQLFLPSPNKLSCFPLNSLPTKPPKFVRLKAASTPTCDDQKSNRTFEKLQPSPWTDRFLSVSIDVSEMDALRKEIDVLKPKVKNTFMSYKGGINSTKEKILMIYLLRSLGLAYHFEEEIYETLQEGFKKIEEMMAGEEDLYTVSIIFWVFRTYGHYISSDVFKRFKGNNGNFKESLKGDVKGILSLYEAAHLQTTIDYILDEALIFASSHLEFLSTDGTCPSHLLMRIRNALTLSQHWNIPMVVAVEYISWYEQEKDHDEMLLKFAKISFKLVQLQYLQDLKIVTKWYKEVDFASNLPPYFKDRIVENNFCVQMVFVEPELSRERIMSNKYFIVLGILDDTLDRYASLPEAESLANCLERYQNISDESMMMMYKGAPGHAMDQQPDYLKFVLNFALESLKEFEIELMPEGTYRVQATTEEFKKFVKANFELAKWAQAAHVPSFEEYMEVGEVTVTVYILMAVIFMCSRTMGTKEAYNWLKSRPKLLKSLSMKGRLMNDIYGFEGDMSRDFVPNAVNCYMKQYGVTKQEAVRELLIMVAETDKAINEELLTTIGVSRLALKAAMGLGQMIAILYNGYEGFTHPEGKIKEYITSILVHQIHL